jgi:hypothetical protein
VRERAREKEINNKESKAKGFILHPRINIEMKPDLWGKQTNSCFGAQRNSLQRLRTSHFLKALTRISSLTVLNGMTTCPPVPL